MKDAERKQKVVLAAWIPLQFVVFIIASLLDSALVKALRTPEMDYWGFRSSLIYSTSLVAGIRTMNNCRREYICSTSTIE